MSIYPGAVFKPTPYGGKVLRNRQGRGILHVAVSNARSLPPWSANTWHFYVAKDGYCEQYVDTEFRAYTSGDANNDAIGIETAGGLGSSAVLNAEPWTPQQVGRIADIMRWESQQPGGAPLQLLPDAQPGRRGWGPHRLGIKHSAGPRPGWWQPGSEVWSSSIGKECPGDAKVRQVPEIIAVARGGPAGGDDMYGPAERDELISRVDKALGILQSLHPAVAAMHVGLMDPTSGVRTLVLELAGRDPVAVDAAELAETLAPMLAPAMASKVDGLSEDDVKQALREVLGSLDAA